MSPSELKRYDVVITTYQTVVQDHDLALAKKSGIPAAKRLKTDQGLFDVPWKVRLLYAFSRHSSYVFVRGSFLTKATAYVTRRPRWRRPSAPLPLSVAGSSQERPS